MISNPILKPLRSLAVLLAVLTQWHDLTDLKAADFAVTKVEDTADGVCDPDDCSLREAIQAANTQAGPDRVILPQGTYRLELANLEFDEDMASSGDLDIRGDLEILGLQGSPLTIIDADGIDRIFEIIEQVSVRIEGVTLRNGEASLDLQFQLAMGGAIFNQGDLSLSRCVIENSSAESGGAVYSIGRLALSSCALIGNSASNQGGALFTEARVILFELLQASNGPGGIALGGGLQEEREMLQNVTLSGNEAPNGAAVYSSGKNVDLSFSTVVQNVSEDGQPLFATDGGSMTLSRTIIVNSAPNCGGPIASLGGNLASDASCNLGEDEATDIQPEDVFGELLDNGQRGGAALTHALTEGSLAIDAGGTDCPGTDQRGAPRPADGDGDGIGGCDIGAYEAAPFQPDSVTFSIPAALDLEDRQSGYRMIGSPLQDVPPPSDFLVGPLGPPNRFRWRLLRYDPFEASYRELLATPASLNDPFFDFQSGRGFWLITANGLEATVSGTANPAAGSPFPLELEPVAGWQQITSPFNFPLEWEGCLADSLPPGASTQLEEFAPDAGPGQAVGYLPAQLMQPARGHWFFLTPEQLAQQDNEPSIEFSPLCASLGPAAGALRHRIVRPDRRLPSGESGWRLRLMASMGALADSYNYLGVDESASDGPDPLDRREPPPIHDLLLFFHRPDWDGLWPLYSSDIRASGPISRGRALARPVQQRSWEFEVWALRPGQAVELSWELSGARPGSLMLWDESADRWIDMLEASSYRFAAGTDGVGRFQVTSDGH